LEKREREKRGKKERKKRVEREEKEENRVVILRTTAVSKRRAVRVRLKCRILKMATKKFQVLQPSLFDSF
jgi:hypothetical protein